MNDFNVFIDYNQKDMKTVLTVIVMFFFVHSALALSLKKHEQALAQFCWRDSYGRGVGTIPNWMWGTR